MKLKLCFLCLLMVNTILLLFGVATNSLGLGIISSICLYSLFFIYKNHLNFTGIDKKMINQLYLKYESVENSLRKTEQFYNHLTTELANKKIIQKKLINNIEVKTNKLQELSNEITTLTNLKKQSLCIIEQANFDRKQKHQLSVNIASKKNQLNNLNKQIEAHRKLYDTYSKTIKYVQETVVNEHLEQIDKMEGLQFEYYTKNLLKQLGYLDIQVTSGSGDQGVDVFASKNNLSYAIQCKCYSSPVGNKAVQEIIAGTRFFNQEVAVVLTNNYFTPSARELAFKTNVLLWDRLVLKNMILEAVKNNIEWKCSYYL
ncbi:restriction endonuclease [Enterococcus faecalis]|uniref:restriction endonuclease n=1 Tax=Enterococcus faecalis TaxID=1351 RepID=UPI00177BD7D0|nr:restriction endonuclease [Enterococcus faecalis]MBD9846439.1 restriction endonuclease [Enterococcus faecalis]